jgi:hypothetical protein
MMTGGRLCDDLIRILEDAGCSKLRDGSRHDVWILPKTRCPFTIPQTLKSRHTANEILKQAGIIRKL